MYPRDHEGPAGPDEHWGFMGRSSILGELAWLAYFLFVLVVAVYAMNIFVVPHHFNDKVADVLAGIFAALLLVTTRAYVARRVRR
ncbi:MAG TPA: hypothetical protein VIN40_09390 [Candidatus Tyrphobacter sp.]